MIRHTTSTGPGSRARTREIGYAQAMGDAADALDEVAASWRAAEWYAAEEGNWHAAAWCAQGAKEIRQQADLCGALYMLHHDDRSPLDPRSFIAYDWQRAPAPKEP